MKQKKKKKMWKYNTKWKSPEERQQITDELRLVPKQYV